MTKNKNKITDVNNKIRQCSFKTPLYTTIDHYTLLYATIHHCTPQNTLYTTIHHCTLLYATIHYYTLLYNTPHQYAPL